MKQVELDNSSTQIVEDSGSVYSKLLGWEVWNFMTLTHAKAEFDESNIINFKGYNDSGKSAMLRALDVLFYNVKPNAQVGFIQDDTEYFRVMAYFDDNVVILRDKYINGQSLYEMYKDNQCIFTTKQNGHLIKVDRVPQPIADYLGVIEYEGLCLNSRSCFEKQLLVQTTGSENYKFLNSVLKSEEIATAGEALNTDKNKVLSDIGTIESTLSSYRETFKESDGVTEDMLNALKSSDKNLDNTIEKLTVLESTHQIADSLKAIPSIPEMQTISCDRLTDLEGITCMIAQLTSLPSIPSLPAIDEDRLNILSQITHEVDSLQSIPSIPNLTLLSLDRLNLLVQIGKESDDLLSVTSEIAEENATEKSLSTEIESMASTMKEFGSKFTRCKNCGALVEIGVAHID